MSDDKKVIFLAYRNDQPTDTEEVLACKGCGNKTWKAIYPSGQEFPELQCACCGNRIGKFGWVEGDDA
jgi:hypothetical protein